MIAYKYQEGSNRLKFKIIVCTKGTLIYNFHHFKEWHSVFFFCHIKDYLKSMKIAVRVTEV